MGVGGWTAAQQPKDRPERQGPPSLLRASASSSMTWEV